MTVASDPAIWRQALHRQPELGFELPQTADMVAELLGTFGVDEIHTGVGRTGIVAVVRRGTGTRAIGLRADMDALPIDEVAEHDHASEVPGAFHGCGHDGHTAMLLGAAERLVHAEFDGTVVLIFQPNEENGLGALAMIDDGLFDRFPVDAIYGMHNKPGVPVGNFATCEGPMMSSEDIFEITITGSGGHASSPQHMVDPIVVAGQIIGALQTIVARNAAPTDIGVVSITEIETDGARNIVPSNVVLRGDCRTFSPAVQELIERRMRELVEGICAAHGATATVMYRNDFVPLVNTPRETTIAADAARSLVGDDHVDASCDLWTASEDFAQMLRHVPGCYIDIGNGTEGACGKTLHNPSYDFNDDILDLGIRYWLAIVEHELGR